MKKTLDKLEFAGCYDGAVAKVEKCTVFSTYGCSNLVDGKLAWIFGGLEECSGECVVEVIREKSVKKSEKMEDLRNHCRGRFGHIGCLWKNGCCCGCNMCILARRHYSTMEKVWEISSILATEKAYELFLKQVEWDNNLNCKYQKQK